MQKATNKRNKRNEVLIGGVAVTHPDKKMFARPVITKAQLVEYYKWIAPRMLPEIKGRPLMLSRFPAGNKQRGFYQKDRPLNFHRQGNWQYCEFASTNPARPQELSRNWYI